MHSKQQTMAQRGFKHHTLIKNQQQEQVSTVRQQAGGMTGVFLVHKLQNIRLFSFHVCPFYQINLGS